MTAYAAVTCPWASIKIV